MLHRTMRFVYFRGMNSVRNFVKGVGAATLLLAGLAATQAGAVGIGKARVESFLGEPLRVRVTLSFVPGENITNACVRIASPPGVESPFIPDLARARFQMIEGPSGAELLITTSRPYTDPILVFPLKVGCGEGGVYREITLLIDPPGMAAPTRAARAAPKPSTAPAPAPRQVTRVRPTQPRSPAPVDVKGGEWFVDRGETLTGIIVESGLDGGDRKRRLELIDEIVAANPNVFRGRGPDYLPAGATLTLPGWEGRKAKGEAPVFAETEEAQAEAEPETAVQPMPEAKQEDFRLELTGERPEGAIVTPEMKAIEEELAKLNAASEEERKLNAELQERLLQLRQQAAELQLVAERMARESEQLTAQEEPGSAPEESAATSADAADATVSTAPVSVAAPEGVPPPAPPTESEPEPAAPAAKPAPSLMDWVNENLLLVAGAIFVVLIFFAFLLRRGGSTTDAGPTLDELIAQKELEREAQLREIEEAAEAVHQDMIDASEAHSAAQEKMLASTAVAPGEAKEEGQEEKGEHPEELLPEADAGHYIFSVEEVDSLLEQSEVLLLFGEPEKAILMIEEYLDGPGLDSTEPRPWLKLFHLLRSEERHTEFEERAISFKRRFNIEKPSWATYSPDGFMGEGVGLEEGCPHIAQRIGDLWEESGKVLAYLDALLVDDRDGERVGFPAMIAEDLMLLRDLAARRALVADELHHAR